MTRSKDGPKCLSLGNYKGGGDFKYVILQIHMEIGFDWVEPEIQHFLNSPSSVAINADAGGGIGDFPTKL